MNRQAVLEALMDKAMVGRTRGGLNSDPPPDKRNRVRVSQAAGLCAREVAHFLKGDEKAAPEAYKGNGADVGTQMEAVILADLERALGAELRDESFAWDRFCGAWTDPHGPSCELHWDRPVNEPWCRGICTAWTNQYRIETELVRGHIDARSAKHKIIADSKTANAQQFDMMAKGKAVKDDWTRQLSTYAKADGATRILVAVRAVGKTMKDGPQIHLVFDFPPDMAAAAQVEDVARQAMAARATGTLPAPAFAKGYWKCKDWCDYRHLCPNGG